MNKDQIFSLIDSLNREGLGNEAWGLVDADIYTDSYLGTEESVHIDGKFLYIYCSLGEGPYRWNWKPDVDYSYALPLRDSSNEVVYIYEW